MSDLLDSPVEWDQAELARRKHLEFMKFMWPKSDPLIVGQHTKAICSILDQAMEDYKNGKSTFLAIKVGPRHGKSDIVSRNLPVNFIGKFPDQEVIVSAYSFGLARGFSRDARKLIRSDKFQYVYPGVRLSKESQSLEEWGVESDTRQTDGKVHWLGIGGTVTGHGGSLIVVDDFFKGRQEAESEVIRDTVWDGFTNDILTRRAPCCITVILATPWSVDDVFGRIKRRMEEDPLFPRFREIKFPAFDESYPQGVLFPERFPKEWYEAQRALLGPYATAALLQCEPTLKSGNQLRTDKIKIISADEVPSDIIFTRGWDLASSEKERFADDPDYTAGPKLGIKWVDSGIKGEPIPILYVTDLIHGRWEATKRDQIIRDTAVADGKITIGVEGFGAYKDAYTRVRDLLSGLRVVKKSQLPGDKVAKASVLEPIFEAGNVYLVKADWNDKFIKEVAEFPGGTHDDIVDGLVVAYDCHSPHLRRVFPDFDSSSVLNFKIDFRHISDNSSLIISSWLDKNLETSIVMGLWSRDKGRLFVFADYVAPNPYPQDTVVNVASIIRECSGGMKRDLKGFEWYGNPLMFSNKDNMQGEYRRRGLHIREAMNYNEYSAVSRVSTLLKYNALSIHSRCGDLVRQMNDWTTTEKPLTRSQDVDGFGLCRALSMLASMLYETGKMQPPAKKMKPYSKESQVYQQRMQKAIDANKLEEFAVNDYTPSTGRDGWMV